MAALRATTTILAVRDLDYSLDTQAFVGTAEAGLKHM